MTAHVWKRFLGICCTSLLLYTLFRARKFQPCLVPDAPTIEKKRVSIFFWFLHCYVLLGRDLAHNEFSSKFRKDILFVSIDYSLFCPNYKFDSIRCLHIEGQIIEASVFSFYFQSCFRNLELFFVLFLLVFRFPRFSTFSFTFLDCFIYIKNCLKYECFQN